MRILIVSDTHRHNDNFLKVLNREGSFDRVIHCGDVEGSERFFGEAAGCTTDIVSGNNDFFSSLPTELVLRIENLNVWVTHGHHYYVSMGTELLRAEARARGMDVVMFGHTHKPCIEEKSGVVALNPGSLSYPRQSGRRPSYIVMERENGGEWRYEIRYL